MSQRSAEDVKASSDHLAGDIAGELATDTSAFGADSVSLLKFHGIYQQDDRDVRRERGRMGLSPDYRCMVRASIPGGALTAEQYMAMDRLAGEVGNASLRVTTREGIQFHFIHKGDLHALVRRLNESLVTTLAACGDVVRNIVACPAPLADRELAGLQSAAAELARRLKPRTDAYWQLWVDGERAASATPPPRDGEVEPLYGTTYLPRKFKIGFAHPGDNCVDIYTHDIGIVPQLQAGQVTAFTILAGGGLGMTHNKPETYPRLSDVLGAVAPQDLGAVVEAIIGIHRDHGDRENRKHARLKYIVDEWGLEAFTAEVVRRLGKPLAAAPDLSWEATHDHLGWHQQRGERWFLGVPVPNGRIIDGDIPLRTALRAVVERWTPGIRLTARQDVLLTGFAHDQRPAVEAVLAAHGVPLVEALAPIQRHAIACPALPTCGLALAEAERVMPDVLTALGAELAGAGIPQEAVHVRMTGCPNGCARPYSTEIGIVGRGKDRYTLFLGGDADGTRLNGRYADHVAGDAIATTLRPVLVAFAAERGAGERFGDWCGRVGIEGLRRRFAPRQDDSRRRGVPDPQSEARVA